MGLKDKIINAIKDTKKYGDFSEFADDKKPIEEKKDNWIRTKTTNVKPSRIKKAISDLAKNRPTDKDRISKLKNQTTRLKYERRLLNEQIKIRELKERERKMFSGGLGGGMPPQMNSPFNFGAPAIGEKEKAKKLKELLGGGGF